MNPSPEEGKEFLEIKPKELTTEQWVDICVATLFWAVTVAGLVAAFGIPGTIGLCGLYHAICRKIRK